MKKYYTRACNFYYGNISRLKIKKKQSLPLNGDKNISFDELEIISRESKKIINFKDVNSLKKNLRTKVKEDIKKITKKKIFFQYRFVRYSNNNGNIKLNSRQLLRRWKI